MKRKPQAEFPVIPKEIYNSCLGKILFEEIIAFCNYSSLIMYVVMITLFWPVQCYVWNFRFLSPFRVKHDAMKEVEPRIADNNVDQLMSQIHSC